MRLQESGGKKNIALPTSQTPFHPYFFGSFSWKSAQNWPLAFPTTSFQSNRPSLADSRRPEPSATARIVIMQRSQFRMSYIHYLSNTLNSHTLTPEDTAAFPNRPITARSHVLSGGQSDQYRMGPRTERSFFSSSRNDLTPAPPRRGGGEKWEVPPLRAPGGGN